MIKMTLTTNKLVVYAPFYNYIVLNIKRYYYNIRTDTIQYKIYYNNILYR